MPLSVPQHPLPLSDFAPRSLCPSFCLFPKFHALGSILFASRYLVPYTWSKMLFPPFWARRPQSGPFWQDVGGRGEADGTPAPGSQAESAPKPALLIASARAAPAHATSVARAPGSHPAHPRSSPGAATPHAPAAASPRGRRRSGLACGRSASFPRCRGPAGLGPDRSAQRRRAEATRCRRLLPFDFNLCPCTH